jgi:hypothetical protein
VRKLAHDDSRASRLLVHDNEQVVALPSIAAPVTPNAREIGSTREPPRSREAFSLRRRRTSTEA